MVGASKDDNAKGAKHVKMTDMKRYETDPEKSCMERARQTLSKRQLGRIERPTWESMLRQSARQRFPIAKQFLFCKYPSRWREKFCAKNRTSETDYKTTPISLIFSL